MSQIVINISVFSKAVINWCPYEESHFAKVMKHQKPSKWDKFILFL